jgi:hypothetical protein
MSWTASNVEWYKTSPAWAVRTKQIEQPESITVAWARKPGAELCLPGCPLPDAHSLDIIMLKECRAKGTILRAVYFA